MDSRDKVIGAISILVFLVGIVGGISSLKKTPDGGSWRPVLLFGVVTLVGMAMCGSFGVGEP